MHRVALLLFYFYHLRRHSANNCIVWNVLNNYGVGGDDNVVADGDISEYFCTQTDEDIVSDCRHFIWSCLADRNARVNHPPPTDFRVSIDDYGAVVVKFQAESTGMQPYLKSIDATIVSCPVFVPAAEQLANQPYSVVIPFSPSQTIEIFAHIV